MEASETSSQTKSFKPKIEIVVQPSNTRFWHKSEEKTSCIPGSQAKFPSIRITNYRGPVTVIISCVTIDPPYKPHPHKILNGTTISKHGVSYIYKHRPKDKIRFKSLFIESVEKEDVTESLTDREHIKAVDPFNTGFEHKYSPDDIKLHCVRLCFQVVLESRSCRYIHVDPVVSDPIYNTQKSSRTHLNICYLSHSSATVAGGSQMCILCEKVPTKDIEVRFYHKESNWEARGKFVGPSVFKQVALVIETPAFKTDTLSPESIKEPIEVNVQLKRPSNGAKSVPRPFQFIPLAGSDYQSRNTTNRFSLKRKRSEYTKTSSVSVCKELQAEIVKEFIKEGKRLNDIPCEPWELPPITSSTKRTESSKLMPNISTAKLQPRLLKPSPAGSHTNVLSNKPIQRDQQMDAMYHFNFKPAPPTELSLEVSTQLSTSNPMDNLINFEAVNTMEDVLDIIKEDINSKQIISNSTDTSGLPHEQQTNFILSLPSVGVTNMTGPNGNTNSNMQQMDNFVHTEVMQEPSGDFDNINFSELFENTNFNIEDYYLE